MLPSEMPAAAFSTIPEVTPVAAPAVTPAAMPAIAASEPRSMPPDMLRPRAAGPLPQIACSAPVELSHFDHPLLHTMRATGERQAAHHRRHRLVVDRRRRREFVCRDLSKPACRRAEGALPRPRHHGAQSRRQRRRDRRHDGAVCDRRDRRASATRAVAGRHQFGAARSPAQSAFGRAAQGHRGAQGHRCRRGADRSAICARRFSPSPRRRAWSSRSRLPPRTRTSICSGVSR